MENPITRAEHEEFRRRLEEENKRQDARIGILEDSVQQIGALATSVEKLALSMQSMLKEQEKQGKRLEVLEGRDGEKWRKVMGYIATAIVGVVLGYLFKRTVCEGAGGNVKNSVESVENAAEKKERRNIKVMDLILVIVGVSLLVFTIVMIQLFKVYGTVPDTLITCVFATLGGECGIMGWIKTTKDRNRERKWEQEDKQEAKAEAAEVPPGDMPAHNA